MIKTIIIDKSETSVNIIKSFLEKMEDIEIYTCFDDFSKLNNFDFSNINLIIFDTTSELFQKSLPIIKEIQKNYPEIKFIALSKEINSKLVTEVLREDIKEFMLKPILPNLLEANIKKVFEKKENKECKGKVITVFSPKAAVGKTTLAVNLGYMLSKNKKICLLDLNFNSQDILTFLDVKTFVNSEYLINNLEKMDEKTALGLISKYKEVELYIFPYKEEFMNNKKVSINEINKIINFLKNIFDFIIIDTQSIIDERNFEILLKSDLILLIGLLNLAQLRSVQKCYELFDKTGYSNDKIKLIINRYIQNSDIEIKDVEELLKKTVSYKIPNNYLVLVDAINRGMTVEETNPNSSIVKSYIKIADDILNMNFQNENQEIPYNHGIFNLLKRMGE